MRLLVARGAQVDKRVNVSLWPWPWTEAAPARRARLHFRAELQTHRTWAPRCFGLRPRSKAARL